MGVEIIGYISVFKTNAQGRGVSPTTTVLKRAGGKEVTGAAC